MSMALKKKKKGGDVVVSLWWALSCCSRPGKVNSLRRMRMKMRRWEGKKFHSPSRYEARSLDFCSRNLSQGSDSPGLFWLSLSASSLLLVKTKALRPPVALPSPVCFAPAETTEWGMELYGRLCCGIKWDHGMLMTKISPLLLLLLLLPPSSLSLSRRKGSDVTIKERRAVLDPQRLPS